MWPTANVAIATGKVSGLVVLDVDAKNAGYESLAALEERFGSLPESIRAQTGGGGIHVLFVHPGGSVPNSAGEVGPGLDIRGDGGYIAAPPSLHFSGRTYAWASDHSATLAEIPEWLYRMVSEPKSRSLARRPTEDGAIPEGKRNDHLASLAGSMRQRGVGRGALRLRSWSRTRNAVTHLLERRK